MRHQTRNETRSVAILCVAGKSAIALPWVLVSTTKARFASRCTPLSLGNIELHETALNGSRVQVRYPDGRFPDQWGEELAGATTSCTSCQSVTSQICPNWLLLHFVRGRHTHMWAGARSLGIFGWVSILVRRILVGVSAGWLADGR